jgi:hypothetical protein
MAMWQGAEARLRANRMKATLAIRKQWKSTETGLVQSTRFESSLRALLLRAFS